MSKTTLFLVTAAVALVGACTQIQAAPVVISEDVAKEALNTFCPKLMREDKTVAATLIDFMRGKINPGDAGARALMGTCFCETGTEAMKREPACKRKSAQSI